MEFLNKAAGFEVVNS